MSSYDKKKLAGFLKTIHANIVDDWEKVPEGSSYTAFGGKGSKLQIMTKTGQTIVAEMNDEGPLGFFLLEAGVLAIQEFIDECLKDREIESQIGGRAIRARLEVLIREFHAAPDVERDFDSIVRDGVLNHLRSGIKSWTVRMPIANLSVKVPFEVGGVRFESFDDGLVANTEFAMSFPSGIDPDQKTPTRAAIIRVANELSTQGSAWATTTIEAHEGRLIEVTQERVETAISVVRSFTHCFHSREQ